MKILTAPFYALFSRKFYSQVMFAGTGRAFLYLFYLATLMLFAAFAAVNTRLLPQTDAFVSWLQSEVPVMEWTPAGLSMKDRTAFALVHPEFGPLARFDMTMKEISAADMGENSVFVTSQKIYLRQPGREGFRIFDVMQLGEKNAQPFEIRPENIGAFYQQVKPWLVVMMSGAFWIGFLLWKILAALFYSWIALVINMTRREKLYYGHLWTIACFALTPAALIQSLQLAIPQLGVLPFGTAGSFVVTTAYLYLAIKGTEPPESAEAAPAV